MELAVIILLWLIFWSLGSILIIRYAKMETLSFSEIFRKSYCPKCKKPLSRKEQIPLLSFCIQKWKCRQCKKTISRLYLFLEIWTVVLFVLLYGFLHKQGRDVLGFWLLTGWSLFLMSLYDILYYEIHIPLLVFSSILLLIAFMVGIFDRYALWWGLWLFLLFLFIYVISYFYVKVKYKVNAEWLWLGDVIMSPYLGTLLFTGVSNYNAEYLFFYILFFLILTGIIGILFFIIQNKVLKKKADFLDNDEMEDNTLPLIPAMILSTVIMLVFQTSLYDWAIYLFDGFLERIFPNL